MMSHGSGPEQSISWTFQLFKQPIVSLSLLQSTVTKLSVICAVSAHKGYLLITHHFNKIWFSFNLPTFSKRMSQRACDWSWASMWVQRSPSLPALPVKSVCSWLTHPELGSLFNHPSGFALVPSLPPSIFLFSPASNLNDTERCQEQEFTLLKAA